MICRLLLILTVLGGVVPAATLDFTRAYPLLASYKSTGQYNLGGLDTWNGQPVTLTNMPDYQNRLLSATFNLYRDATALNIMYIQITDVVTTRGAYWSGPAFNNVTLTGMRVVNTDPVPVLGFSNAFANPGQLLAYGGSTESTQPLETTPGYQLDSTANSFWIHTSNPAAVNGFTSLGGIYGTSRIRGGGIFQLTFAPYINVQGFSFQSWNVQSQYGDGNQFITAALVPEPSTYCVTGCSLVLLGITLKKRRQDAAAKGLICRAIAFMPLRASARS